MKRITLKRANSVLIAAALGGIVWVSAGDLNPPSGAVTPTMKTLTEVEPRIAINATNTPGDGSSTFKITQPGSYYLTGNVTGAINTNGLTIEADGVTVDLAGYTLTGAGGTTGFGIIMSGRSNVEIRNGTIRDFGATGIRANLSVGRAHRVIGVRAVSNGQHGISLSGEGHLVMDCTVQGNGGFGIALAHGTVTRNTANGNMTDGISVGGSCTVTGNTARDNGDRGIAVGEGSTVTGNTARQNGDIGIIAFQGCTVTGNTAFDNGSSGIVTLHGCTVTGNTASQNGDNGIFVGFASTATGNTAWSNDSFGISLGGNNLVDQNTAFDNDQSGEGFSNMNQCPNCTFGLNHAP